MMNKINKNWSRVSQREAQAASKADQGRELYNTEWMQGHCYILTINLRISLDKKLF